MSLKTGNGGFAAAVLPSFESKRQRTTSATSSVLSSSSSSALFTSFPFASFYLSHFRRRPAFLLCIVLSWLLLLAVLDKYGTENGLGIRNGLTLFKNKRTADAQEAVVQEPQPLTELGFEADYVYENVGSTDLNVYRQDLETFLKARFPLEDAREENETSLMGILHTFVPPPSRSPIVHPQKALQQLAFLPWKWTFNSVRRLFFRPKQEPIPRILPTIPKTIFQTGPYPGNEPPAEKVLPLTWKAHNQHYTYKYYDNDAASSYVENRFNESLVNQGRGGGIAHVYQEMRDVPVMQSDFWRYAILATEGGIYCRSSWHLTLIAVLISSGPIADIDTKCLKPVDGWHRPPWLRNLNLFVDEPRRDPAIIVGIEVDVGSRPDWHTWWPRPLGMVQWTIASTKGHPILLDTMRRVVDAIDQANSTALSVEGQHRSLDSVVEKTGPAPFTDSVLRCKSPFSFRVKGVEGR